METLEESEISMLKFSDELPEEVSRLSVNNLGAMKSKQFEALLFDKSGNWELVKVNKQNSDKKIQVDHKEVSYKVDKPIKDAEDYELFIPRATMAF